MDFYRTVFKIALPIIMQNFLTSFVNMIDTVMVGQLGAVEIAAVGLGNQIFFVMNTVMFGVVSGGSIFMSQFWGKKDISRLRQTMGITVALAFAVSMLFTVLAAFFPEKCLSVYTSDVSVILHGASYLRVVSPCYFFFGISMALGHALRSTEHVNLPMTATGISVLVNAAGNAAFIFDIYSHEVKKGEDYTEKSLVVQINLSYKINNEEMIREYKIRDKHNNEFIKNFIIYDINKKKIINE